MIKRKVLLLFVFAIVLTFNSHNLYGQKDTLLARELTSKAISFLDKSHDSLLFYGNKALNLSEQIGDWKGVGLANSAIGNYYWMKSDYSKALEYYDKSLSAYRTGNYVLGSAKVLSNFGMVYSILGDYGKATQYFLESLKIAEAGKAKTVMALTNNNLGLCYGMQKKYDDAAEAFERAMALSKEVNDAKTLAAAYTNLGDIYQTKGEFDKSLQYHRRALVIFDSLQIVRGRIACYNNIGELLLNQNLPTQAEHYHLDALALSKQQGLPLDHMTALVDLGDVNLNQKKFKESLSYFDQAMAIAISTNSREMRMRIYKGLSDSYKGLGKFNASLDNLQRHLDLKDSIFSQESFTTISNLRLAYDLEKKDASIALLTRDNKIATLSRNMSYSIAIGLFVILLLSGFFFLQKVKKDKKLMEQQQQLHEAHQSFVQAELNNQKAREEELKKELDFRSRTLTTYTLNLIQKNAMLDEVKAMVLDILKKTSPADAELKKLVRLIDYSFTLDRDWEGFKTYFEQVHPDFFKNLKDNYPQLSSAELRLCALIRLSLSIKETATILGISPDSVKVARHRLRKKLNLSTDGNLTDFILSIGSADDIHHKSFMTGESLSEVIEAQGDN